MEAHPDRGLVRVFGDNFLGGPLYEGDSARTIVMYDGAGTPVVILARMADNSWTMGTARDSDWETVRKRFGVD